MPHLKDYDTQYGNLLDYKYNTRPEAYRLHGGASRHTDRHRRGMQSILRVMLEHGACTTWEIAKFRLGTGDVPLIRAKEKEYRRLFLGRYDTKKRTGGMLDLGIVVRERSGRYSRYRLSIHGILYCMDIFDPDEDGVDAVARTYAGALPKVFGRWDWLKSVAGSDVYKLRILAKGIVFDGAGTPGSGGTPLYELMSFVHTRYARRFGSISEEELAEQVSYWFYTLLLYYRSAGVHADRSLERIGKMREAVRRDAELSGWYGGFVAEAREYYRRRAAAVSGGCWTP